MLRRPTACLHLAAPTLNQGSMWQVTAEIQKPKRKLCPACNRLEPPPSAAMARNHTPMGKLRELITKENLKWPPFSEVRDALSPVQ